MITTSDLLHLPYTRDLTEGGIAYALRSIPYLYRRMGSSLYDSLRHTVASAAVQLAFRRYLAEQAIPFDVEAAVPFTEHERYDVSLQGHRCDVQSFLISHRDQITEMKRHPQTLLRAPAIIASDQHAGDGHSPFDLYLFAFLCGWFTRSAKDWQDVTEANQPHYLVHVMPEAWNRPKTLNPLGTLALKSEADQTQTLELAGQNQRREMHFYRVELPPRTRLEVPTDLFSLSAVHSQANPRARIGIRSAVRKEPYLIGAQDWGNIWVYGLDIWLAGYITRDEFRRRASYLRAGSTVFQQELTQVKNLAVPVSDLKPLSELFEKAKVWNPQ